jgi:hypothetical protein
VITTVPAITSPSPTGRPDAIVSEIASPRFMPVGSARAREFLP